MKDKSKIVIFDWGGVVDNTCFETKYNFYQLMIDAARVATHVSHSYSDEAVWSMLNHAGYGRMSTGYPDRDSFEEALATKLLGMGDIKSHLDAALAATNFIKFTLSHFKFIPYYDDIVRLEYETGERCKIALMSDLCWLEACRLHDQIDTTKFDHVFESYLCGCTKVKDGGLFPYVQKEINMPPHRVLFIDDVEANIAKASKIGWNTYRCKEHDYVGISNAINMFLNKD